eukprot:scaffold93180_cov65-Phaeocystis_antarctica.AAC.4
MLSAALSPEISLSYLVLSAPVALVRFTPETTDPNWRKKSRFALCTPSISEALSWQPGGLPKKNIEPPSMAVLRVALLWLASVASAVRLATNVECLPARYDEVFLDFSGVKPQHA